MNINNNINIDFKQFIKVYNVNINININIDFKQFIQVYGCQ